jgi:hydrogenase expression/formation protein HypE
MSNKHRRSPIDLNDGVVELAHGAGGSAMTMLISEIFYPAFNNDLLLQQNDQAIFNVDAGKLAFATDSFVVSPLFFPGGNIGSLAVNGTINDIALGGATPMYLSASFILEEGFPLKKLLMIAKTMGACADAAGVKIITGDTKVVERGKADGVFITTTGIGVIRNQAVLSANQITPGDCVILSGEIGDHGVAILSKRENLNFETNIISDQAALHELIQLILETGGDNIRVMRDPTRGGLASALNELAEKSDVGFVINENKIPINSSVAAACEFLGLDPLYVANEGKLIAVVAPSAAADVLKAMRSHRLGYQAEIIGVAIEDSRFFVQMITRIGGRRIIDHLSGELLPRIC